MTTDIYIILYNIYRILDVVDGGRDLCNPLLNFHLYRCEAITDHLYIQNIGYTFWLSITTLKTDNDTTLCKKLLNLYLKRLLETIVCDEDLFQSWEFQYDCLHVQTIEMIVTDRQPHEMQ